jgi:hypothetical protein
LRNRSVRIPILAIAVLSVLALFVCPAGAQAPKPIAKQGLIDALRIGGLTLQELIQFVRDRGVDFQVSPEVEAELRSAAAQRDLIEAVRGRSAEQERDRRASSSRHATGADRAARG